jgi:hypothetical protein
MLTIRTMAAKPEGVYRSHLEHEWAKYFTSRKIDYTYEPRYYGAWLPDFSLFLTPGETLLEIKPTLDIFKVEIGKCVGGISSAINGYGRNVLAYVGTPYDYMALMPLISVGLIGMDWVILYSIRGGIIHSKSPLTIKSDIVGADRIYLESHHLF